MAGQFSMLASGTPVLNEKGAVEIAVIVLRPIKEVHRLVNRFSGARARFRFGDMVHISLRKRPETSGFDPVSWLQCSYNFIEDLIDDIGCQVRGQIFFSGPAIRS